MRVFSQIKKFKTAAFGFAAVCLSITSAHATLISRDLVFGSNDGLITFDSDTNLEWLDLTATVGNTYNSISGSSFVTDPTLGFGFATTDDVATLYTNAGITSFGQTALTSANFVPAQLLIDLLGCTANCNSNSLFQQGMADLSVFDPLEASLAFVNVNFDTALGRAVPGFANLNKDTSSNVGFGSYLFREASNTSPAPVPLPASLALYGSGLLGLAFFRRRRRIARA